LKVGLVGVDVAMVVRLPLARAWFSAWMGVYQRECGLGDLAWAVRFEFLRRVVAKERLFQDPDILLTSIRRPEQP
jgi:hypothetical protein